MHRHNDLKTPSRTNVLNRTPAATSPLLPAAAPASTHRPLPPVQARFGHSFGHYALAAEQAMQRQEDSTAEDMQEESVQQQVTAAPTQLVAAPPPPSPPSAPQDVPPPPAKFGFSFASLPLTDPTVQRKPNTTGLPDNLKAGVENLSGMSLDDVNVHYNSSAPKEVGALAYAQGTDIHVASGQEQHLPHEAWHVVQQKQGRVQPTFQMKMGVGINDDAGLELEADMMGDKAAKGGSVAERLAIVKTADSVPMQRYKYKTKEFPNKKSFYITYPDKCTESDKKNNTGYYDAINAKNLNHLSGEAKPNGNQENVTVEDKGNSVEYLPFLKETLSANDEVNKASQEVLSCYEEAGNREDNFMFGFMQTDKEFLVAHSGSNGSHNQKSNRNVTVNEAIKQKPDLSQSSNNNSNAKKRKLETTEQVEYKDETNKEAEDESNTKKRKVETNKEAEDQTGDAKNKHEMATQKTVEKNTELNTSNANDVNINNISLPKYKYANDLSKPLKKSIRKKIKIALETKKSAMKDPDQIQKYDKYIANVDKEYHLACAAPKLLAHNQNPNEKKSNKQKPIAMTEIWWAPNGGENGLVRVDGVRYHHLQAVPSCTKCQYSLPELYKHLYGEEKEASPDTTISNFASTSTNVGMEAKE